LPIRFLLNEKYNDIHKIENIKNKYKFLGHPGNRIMFADKLLPIIKKNINLNSPLPFSFPVYTDTHVEIILSNVYYYEVTITKEQNIDNIDNWYQQSVSIGYGNSEVPFNSHAGWFKNSIGYHSDDGCLFNNINHKGNPISKSWSVGDTAGAGLIYIESNQVIPFFTLNGKLIKKLDKPIVMTEPFFPIVGYDHPNTISINFSTRKFKFDIKKIINEYSNCILSSKNNFINYYDLGMYLNDIPKKILTQEDIVNNNSINEQILKQLNENNQEIIVELNENTSNINSFLNFVMNMKNQ
jgi:hypothetical protein